MCIIIDANCMASVFKSNSEKHKEFKPVLDWIKQGKGKMIIGGSQYKAEIKSYIGYISELAKVNKTQSVSDEKVDKACEELKNKVNHRDYDDPHLLALIRVSKTKLICSLDERAYKYFKNKKLLKCDPPKIYNKARNKDTLLTDNNIAAICEPCRKLNKDEQSKVNL